MMRENTLVLILGAVAVLINMGVACLLSGD